MRVSAVDERISWLGIGNIGDQWHVAQKVYESTIEIL